MEQGMIRATVFWLCLGLGLGTSPICVYGAGNMGNISPEVAAELTTFGDSLAQFLRYWIADNSDEAISSSDSGGMVWLSPFDDYSPLPRAVQRCISETHADDGVSWGFAPSGTKADPTSKRIAVIASELAKAAANYQYALDAHVDAIKSSTESASLVCLPGEECKFKLEGGEKSPSPWQFFENKATLPLKSGLRSCDASKGGFLAASCLNEETEIVKLATFWYRAVVNATDVRSTPNEKLTEKSPRDRLFDADSEWRLMSFRRSLLPYSQWINTQALI